MRTRARGGEGSGRRCVTTSPARTRTSPWTAASSRRAAGKGTAGKGTARRRRGGRRPPRLGLTLPRRRGRTSAKPHRHPSNAKTTHYDYDAPGDAERNAAGEGVDALAAALATLQDDDDGRVSNREGTNHETEGSADDLGSVDARAAAVEARGEALASLRAELAAHAHVLHRAAFERARASHERARAQTLRATESIGAAKSEALRRRLATRAADREAQAGE